MEALIQYLGASQFEIQARGHRIFCDQPEENGGHDEAMTPPELLLASLGSCAAYYAVEYLKAAHQSAEGVTARVTAEKGHSPARLRSFRITVEAPTVTDPKHREGIRRAVQKCLIHNTLTHPPDITIGIETAVLATPLAA